MNMQQYYEKYSNDTIYQFFPLGNEQRIKQIFPFLKSPMLDVGCGYGCDTQYYKSLGFKVEGTDITKQGICACRKRYPKTTFFVHDFEKEPTKKKYLTITCFDVIEHVFDYNSFIQNLAASLNKQGTIIFTTPNVFGLGNRIRFLLGDNTVTCHYQSTMHSQLEPHIRLFGIKSITEILKRNGLKINAIYTYASRAWLPNNLKGSITIICQSKE